MLWKTCLKRKVMPFRGPDALQQFLREHSPRFTAPRDVAAWRKQVPVLRRQMLEQVMLRGWPARLLREKPRVQWTGDLHPSPDYRIRKLRYEAAPDYWIPALLYEPMNLPRNGRVPVVINPNGHHRGGKAAHYKQIRCINLAKRGMISLNFECPGMSELEADNNHFQFAFLDFVGLAGVGLFYLAMKRGLDVLLDHSTADRKRVAMTGLSGGGWQTIILSALDPRITVSVPVAGYMPIRNRIGCFSDIGDVEQAPTDMLTVCDYDTLTAMLAPRPALLILNEYDDCCFRTEKARPVIYDAVRPTYRAFGALDCFATYSNQDPGTHNYGADNRSQLYKFLDKQFGLSTSPVDIPCDHDLYSEHELAVGLPATQKTAIELALDRAKALRRPPATRARLEEVLRLPRYKAKITGLHRGRGIAMARIGPWRLPVAFSKVDNAKTAVLFLHDEGRAGAAAFPGPDRESHLFVPDLLGTGESVFDERHRMLIDTVGQRQLGIRVAQVLALAKVLGKQTGQKKLELRANGLNSCVTALIAAALRPTLFRRAHLTGLPLSLVSIIHWRLPYNQCQPTLCFGLLEVVDVPELIQMAKGVELIDGQRQVPPMRV